MSKGNRRRARGGSRLNSFIALVIVVSLFVAGIRIIPVYVRAYEFRDAMRSQAKFAGVDRKPKEVVREELYERARSLDLPIAPDQIQVALAPGGITVVSHFSVPVDLILFQYRVNFEFTADTRSAF